MRKEKEEFDNYVQQDAHEFLNFLINHINEIILAERNQGQKKSATTNEPPEPTWVHEIFQGILTSETRCLNCETVSSKDENFFDLQVDVDQNTSITHCLRCFSNTETLCSDNKFKCDNCCRWVNGPSFFISVNSADSGGGGERDLLEISARDQLRDDRSLGYFGPVFFIIQLNSLTFSCFCSLLHLRC